MINRIRTQPWYPAVLLGLLLSLLGISVALGAGSIDPANKWAWSPTAGWINFDPDYGGVVVYPNHLEGYAWGENIGWIRLGTHTSGGAHTYANDAATTYGVNRAADGSLSGYAWSPGVGWINFDPDGPEQVSVDPVTGEFSGFAWAENIGWIGMRGAGATPRHSVDLARYSISGEIVNSGAGPLAGVSVSAGGTVTTTDASGVYTLTGLLAGSTYTVTPALSGNGFNPTLTVIQLITQSVGGANFDWFAAHTISGRVVDGSSAPVAGVTVSDGERTTTTDAGGYYTLTVPAGASYTIVPSLADHSFAPPAIVVPEISSDLSGQDFVATLNTYGITGLVLKDGSGVEGVTLRATALASGRVYTATTDASGAYRIEGGPAGDYRVVPFLAGALFAPAQAAVTLVDADVAAPDFLQAGLPNIPSQRYAPGDIYSLGEQGYSGTVQPNLATVVAVSFNGFRAGVSWMNNPDYTSIQVTVPIVSPPTLLEGPVVLHTSDGNAIPLTGTFLVKTDFAADWAVQKYSTWLDDGKYLVVDGANVGEAATVTFNGSNVPNFRKLGNNRVLVPINNFTFSGQSLVLTKASGSTVTYTVSDAPPILINEIAPGQPGHFDVIAPIWGDLSSVGAFDRGTYAGAGGGILPNSQFLSNADLYWDDGVTVAGFSWGYVQTYPALVGPRTIAADGVIGSNNDINWSGTATI